MTDFNIDIDPATNLPELPEGMVWNVREKHGYVFVEILRDCAEYYKWFKDGADLPDTYPGYEWTRTGISREVAYETTERKRLWGFLWSREVQIPCTRTEYQYRTREAVKNLTYFNDQFEWTPEFLLDATFKVMEAWEDAKQEKAKYEAIQEAKDSILGTYPPKRREETPVEDDDD